MPRHHKYVLLLIALFTLIRLGVAPLFGLGVDEAHYVLYAKYLDWSYVDHPPLVGWVHAPFYYLAGTNEFLARLPAILLFAAVAFLAYGFIFRITKSASLSFIAVLALQCSFMFNALALMLLPDSLLLLLVFWLIFLAEKIDREKKLLDFVFLGVVLGLMGLAKYTSVLLVPPLLIYFLMKRRYDIVFSPFMFLAAFIALVMIMPVLYWNYMHDFISFRYQGTHVFGTLASSFKRFAESLGAQFGAYSPPLFVVAFYGFFKSFREKNDSLRLAVLFGATILIFFLLTSFFERTLPHWPAVFYLLFIPVGTVELLESGQRWKKNYLYYSIGFSLFLTLFIYVELAGKFFEFPDYKSPFRDIYGFSKIVAKADEIIKKDSSSRQKAIAVSNWTMGSRTLYYNIPYHHNVFVLDQRRDQFDVWEKASPQGYDLLLINSHFHNVNPRRDLKCSGVQFADKLDILLNGGKVDTVEYWWCRNYGGFAK